MVWPGIGYCDAAKDTGGRFQMSAMDDICSTIYQGNLWRALCRDDSGFRGMRGTRRYAHQASLQHASAPVSTTGPAGGPTTSERAGLARRRGRVNHLSPTIGPCRLTRNYL